METLGQKLRNLRQQRWLKINQVAEFVGVFPRQISGYEKDTMVPKINTLKRLCKFYGVTASELLGF